MVEIKSWRVVVTEEDRKLSLVIMGIPSVRDARAIRSAVADLLEKFRPKGQAALEDREE